MKVPIVKDANGVEHKLSYLARRFAIEYRPFVTKLVAQLSHPALYAEAAKALIFLNAELQSDEHNNFKALASLTQISALTERNMRDDRNRRRRNVRVENCSEILDEVSSGEETVPESCLSLTEIGQIIRRFPKTYRKALRKEEIEFYLKNKAGN
ncbi:MAG: hypothetical protein JNM39_18660 [Bdellovibrionaceae bacterium]|nr:hypothetical protein [Pseudobdellovibrionaceae bacterium]